MRAAQLSFTQFNGLSKQTLVPAPAAQPVIRMPVNVHRQRLNVEAAVATRRAQVEKRHRRVRNKVSGTEERPRLAVFRSNTHIYAQVIDDTAGNTLAAASTLSPEIREKINGNGGNVEAAKLVGAKIAELCKQKNIEQVSFDRGGFRYHGRVQALADAAREAGLSF